MQASKPRNEEIGPSILECQDHGDTEVPEIYKVIPVSNLLDKFRTRPLKKPRPGEKPGAGHVKVSITKEYLRWVLRRGISDLVTD